MSDQPTARSRPGERVLSLRGISRHFGAVSTLTDFLEDTHDPR
jgi:D-xylose transport system ATP-binding protein